MHLNNGRRLVAVSILLAAVGCNADAPPSGPQQPRMTVTSALKGAPSLILAAQNGTLGRGEQDRLVALEARLPGFGGFYIANGEVRVHMKGSGHSTAHIQRTLHSVFSQHENPRVREVLVRMNSATVLRAAYTLAELVAIENRIAASPIHLPGWTGAGINITRNRIVVMFKDDAALSHGLSLMESIGVPVAALHPVVMPQMELAGTWSDAYMPTRGGIKIKILNNGRWPGYWATDYFTGKQFWKDGFYFDCSLGFNVKNPAGTTFLLTAGHCPNQFAGVNGAVGDSIFQPHRVLPTIPPIGGEVATFINNPPYDEAPSCPIENPNTGKRYDFCTDADVALGQYLPGMTGERKIGVSTTGGVNGNTGTNQINNWYVINAVLTPEYVDSTMLHHAAKSGFSSGTTSGEILTSSGPIPSTICMNPMQNPCVRKTIMLLRQATGKFIMRGGDSGAPVFTGNPGNGAPYAAIGIATAGTPVTGIPCTLCQTAFSRWDMIEQRLGYGAGTLRPQTTP
ncbi:MAG: hypothetical protein H7Z74_00325 [Anaerolineae bacterium]|nr:hypothetical protein [Gemmatimonadaceae bacterium]